MKIHPNKWAMLVTSCLIIAACSETSFLGKSGKSSSSKSSGGDGKNSGDNPDGATDGSQPCQEKITLPEAPTALKEVFHWKASGPTAAYNQVMASPVAAPLKKGDKIATIVVPAFQGVDYMAGGAYLYAISGSDGAQKWVSDFKVIASASAAIGDIDGDGENDIVAVGLDGKLRALSADGVVKWTSAVPSFGNFASGIFIGGPTLADIDRDGSPEVLMSAGVFNGKDGTLKFALTESNSEVIAADVDKTGLKIISLFGIYKPDGSEVCKFSKAAFNPAAMFLKADDAYATIIARTEDSVVTGFSGKDCSSVFEVALPGGGGGPMNLADNNGDGILDFTLAGSKALASYKSDGTMLWSKTTKDSSSGVTGLTTFDFAGSGKTQVVYNDEDYLRIFDGETGNVLFETENSSGTLYEYPIVIDADGDGHANIVVVSNDFDSSTNQSSTGVKMFSSPKNDWFGTRMIWNQHGYNPYLVGDNGELTNIDEEKIWKPWLKSMHLAGFRNNIPRPLAPCQ